MIINVYQSKIAQQPRLRKEEIFSKKLGIGQKTIHTTIFKYTKYKTIFSPNKKKNKNTINIKINKFDKCKIKKIIYSF